jgi:DNA-binding beta-propeller fold protein YncE
VRILINAGAVAVVLWTVLVPPANAGTGKAPLELEATIALPNVKGRIDHLAVDLARERLFIAELGNGSVDAIDLRSRQTIQRITGLEEPQGIAYAPGPDLLAVAGGGDGALHFYKGEDFASVGRIVLGEDADNVHLDSRTGHLLVGYGAGALAVIDPALRQKLAETPLPAHPEGFQLAPDGRTAFVNLPDANEIGVVDLSAKRLKDAWKVPSLSANFPIAVSANGDLVASVFRNPARLVLISLPTGKVAEQLDTCGDADDVFFDGKRSRIYVSCGAGALDVFQQQATATTRIQQIKTGAGARTSLFVPELDRLFVAVRADGSGGDAKILVFRPVQ